MASDSRAYSGDKHPIGTKVKIRRLDDGTLIGCSTTTPGGGEAVLDWYEAGHPDEGHELPEHFTFLAVEKNGDAYYATQSEFMSGPLDAEFFAIGSGEQYAYGACLAGATAVEAVRAACMADTFTDFPIYAGSHRRKTLWVVER
jgi:ATP-dependent protease HslVU (ClpYQ) peptidase subunit